MRLEIYNDDFGASRRWTESTRRIVAEQVAELLGEDYVEITVTAHLDDSFDPRVEVEWEIEDGRCLSSSLRKTPTEGAATVRVSRVTGLAWI